MFRSTGSYEPDPNPDYYNLLLGEGFDPQALTSLTGIGYRNGRNPESFDPQALTSLTEP